MMPAGVSPLSRAPAVRPHRKLSALREPVAGSSPPRDHPSRLGIADDVARSPARDTEC